MTLNFFTKMLRTLSASERFEMLFGPDKSNLESRLKCRILTLPMECVSLLPENISYFLVKDKIKNSCYLAVIKSLN